MWGLDRASSGVGVVRGTAQTKRADTAVQRRAGRGIEKCQRAVIRFLLTAGGDEVDAGEGEEAAVSEEVEEDVLLADSI